MNARFGIIAGLTIALAGCNDGSKDELFVEGTSALDCGGAGCTFADATKPNAPDPSGYGHGGHEDDGYDDHADAGAPCAYDNDCATGERCERQHGVSYCAPHDDHDSDDDHGGYAGGGAKPEKPDAEAPCDGHDCDDDYDNDDYDRSGSNSGPH